MGRRYLDQPPQSAEAIGQLGPLPAGAADGLRVIGSGDNLILHVLEVEHSPVFMLSIRHHRELSFDFACSFSGLRAAACHGRSAGFTFRCRTG